MKTDPELPELPEPDGTSDVVVGQIPVGAMMGDVTECVDAWSEPLVRAWGLACYRAGMERAAQIAEKRVAPLRADSSQAHEVASANAHNIAAAIRKEAGNG